MESLSNLNDWIKLVGTIIAVALGTSLSLTFIFSKVRRSDLDLLRQNNEDLKARVDIVENDKINLQKRVDDLEQTVKVIQEKNGNLGDIISIALSHYWQEHPKEAIKVAKLLATK